MYYEQGKLNEAIQSYQEAIAREPNFPEAYNNLGNALREASRPDEAIACYTMCIQLQFARPQNAQMARALQANPQMAAMQQAQRLGVAYNNLGGILKMQGRAAEAIACYEHVALLQPDSPEAHANLASAYKDAARQDTAISSYRRALQLRPDFPEAFANLVHSLQCICEWQDRQTLFARLEGEVRRELAADRLPPVQPFHAMAYPFSAELALKISAKYAEYCAVTAARMGVPKLPHPPAKPLQVSLLPFLSHFSSPGGWQSCLHAIAVRVADMYSALPTSLPPTTSTGTPCLTPFLHLSIFGLLLRPWPISAYFLPIPSPTFLTFV